MKKIHPDVEMLQIIAKALGELKDQMTFVGGAITTLFIDDEASPDSISTVDIDCTLELKSALDFEKLENALSKRGFKHPQNEEDTPICRWMYGSIMVDIMPSDPQYLGFSNIWYPEGIANRVQVELPSGESIYIFSLAYFIATKIEAVKNRGGNDLRFSHDFEDIVLVLSGCTGAVLLMELVSVKLESYFKKEFKLLMKNTSFEEAVESALFRKGESTSRSKWVMDFFKNY